MSTLTVVLTDTVTNDTVTGTADFTITGITADNPGDQTGTVGIPI